MTNAPILSGQWNYPTNIIFGAGMLSRLPESCRKLNINKPLLITDNGLANAPIVQAALEIAKNAGMDIGLFTEVKGNPTGKNVMDGVSAYHDGDYDGVIAFGGGSGLDAAKAVALMVGQDRPLWDFEDVGDNWLRVNENGIAPLIAIPTTAGTGSEVGRASVITNEDSHEKKIIFHPKMLPEIVIEDPELTYALPAHLTAATGIDAFVHCFEAFCAPGFHPMSDGIGLEGMRLIANYLPRAYKDGNDAEARANMLVASSMGATAFQKGLGGVHALAHPLGALYDKHHGLLNAILLPYVMVRNRAEIADKMEILSRTLNLNNTGFDAVLEWVLKIRQDLEIPHSLNDIGLSDTDAAKIGQMAVCDPSAGGNPVTLTAEDYTAIFLNALTGQLSSNTVAT